MKITYLGDRVIIDGKYSGKVKFIGALNDSLLVSELYVGVKLDEPDPKFGTGHYHGKYYFDAPQGFGVFVKYDQVSKCKKFDPTIEGGPNKKVLKNQSSLAWLYGQSLDEAEVKEHASVKLKSTSAKFNRKMDAKTALLERQQKALLKEWTEEYGQKHSLIMLDKFNKISLAVKQEEQRIREEEERRKEEEEQRRLEDEYLQDHEFSSEKNETQISPPSS